jgi:hypothetical protein
MRAKLIQALISGAILVELSENPPAAPTGAPTFEDRVVELCQAIAGANTSMKRRKNRSKLP